MKALWRLFSSCFLVVGAFGQPAQPQRSFEVASIKTAPQLTNELIGSGKAHVGLKANPAHADFGSFSVMSLICKAYGVKPFQVSGPEWLSTDRYDIDAKLPAGSSVNQIPEMTATLLRDRFKLVLRRETKETRIHVLSIGKDGAKLATRPADYVFSPKGERPMTMEAYVYQLSAATNLTILDRTGLTGEYMIDTAPLAAETLVRFKAHSDPGTASDPDGASPALGMVKKLGLKLEEQKLPIEFLTVAQIKRTPVAN